MALDINIRITADTEGTFSEREASVLQALAGVAAAHGDSAAYGIEDRARRRAAAQEAPAEAPAAPAAAEAPAPAKRTRRTKAQIEADKAAEAESTQPAFMEDFSEPVADPEQAEEQAASTAAPERTLKEALDMATKFLTEGGADGRKKVMAALEGTRASKVSELAGADITTFVTALEA